MQTKLTPLHLKGAPNKLLLSKVNDILTLAAQDT
jgi:hypothetical protein